MIGYIATILLSISYIPQLVKVIKGETIKGLSFNTYIVLAVGLALWCIHALDNKDWALLISSFISLIQVIIIIVYLKVIKRN